MALLGRERWVIGMAGGMEKGYLAGERVLGQDDGY